MNRSRNYALAHHVALNIVCPECHAAVGDPCFKRTATGHRIPLGHSPTHALRLRDAERRNHLPFHEAKDTER